MDPPTCLSTGETEDDVTATITFRFENDKDLDDITFAKNHIKTYYFSNSYCFS